MNYLLMIYTVMSCLYVEAQVENRKILTASISSCSNLRSTKETQKELSSHLKYQAIEFCGCGQIPIQTTKTVFTKQILEVDAEAEFTCTL